MELEAISSCCSSSSPSVPSSSSSGEDAANMTELEAAEALADLAQLAIMREQVFESATSWGSKGKRVRKRVKTESPPCDSRFKPADSETLPTPDLAEERAVKEEGEGEEEEEAQPISRQVTKVAVKTDIDGETPKPNLASNQRCRSNGCGRSRQNLSEAEREERRIRRILANRESARQTIRRRQAMCEELSKKAADLTYENENLRREKDWALKEFQSLETINKQLKEQVSKSVKPDTKEEAEESLKPSQVEMSASSTPLYFYNQNPYQLFCWPHVTQPLETRNGFTAPLTTTSGVASAKTMTSQENESPADDDNGQKTHFYVVPCPWFLPHPDQSNGVPSGLQDAQKVMMSSNGHHVDDSSAKPVEVTKTLRSHLPTRVKEEDSGTTEARPLYDLNESATDVLSEGGDGFPVTHQANSFKKEDVSDTTNGGVTPMQLGHHVLISLPGKKQGSSAAAEARKRRKELTRLKNLHGRQCRMQV